MGGTSASGLVIRLEDIEALFRPKRYEQCWYVIDERPYPVANLADAFSCPSFGYVMHVIDEDDLSPTFLQEVYGTFFKGIGFSLIPSWITQRPEHC
jgi:hypothetical protein